MGLRTVFTLPVPSPHQDHVTMWKSCVLFFTFLSINHTVQCPRSKKWMPSAAILFMATCRVQVWRVSATWTEEIWKQLESRLYPWKYVVLTGLSVFGWEYVTVMFGYSIHSLFFSSFICNLNFLKINQHKNVTLVFITRSSGTM